MNVHCSRPFTIRQNTTDAAADDDDHDDDVAVIKQASTRSLSNYRRLSDDATKININTAFFIS